MKLRIFNASLLTGVALSGTGVGLQFGLGYGIATAGALVLATTVYLQRVAGVKV